ncbi:glucosaminidase domain-containing protein [Glaciecola sp. XM2]|jgi:Bax protein|uniref:glucosaminidase domain-containing protein n=1 Tax=Glaciecola sp. XM2 TaxID=1914931 RepID=UPI001BDE0BE9|nr:glucosaminidase domain-containing protein [Glaciecola sp. XM2]MBT1449630.1 glucosaminidase domain-containing protein [Glaciecola sp. XM2]
MHKLKIISLALLSVLVVVLTIYFSQQSPPSIVKDIPEVDFAEDPVPDFASIEDVTEKKNAFFSYLRPAVEAQNAYLLNLRNYIQGLRSKVISNEELNEEQQQELDWLIKEYRVDPDQELLEIFDVLLRRIDIIPVELVLVQSANESAWGTSRFAQDGYNFFGMWCFKKGCGFVPSQRSAGANHEVAKYDNLSKAMYSYMRNLNRHPAYTELRNIRNRLRMNQQEITAIKLSEGLIRYSERGNEYIEELQSMIRVNKELI